MKFRVVVNLLLVGMVLLGGRAHSQEIGIGEWRRDNVKHEDGRVWIVGVPTLHYGIGKEVTFIGSLEAALAATERPYSYTNLMGWSGIAFRTRRFEGDNGQLGSTSDGVGEFPDEFNAIEKAAGWHIESAVVGKRITNYKEPVDMSELAPEIVSSIDTGLPALAYPPHWNMAVIYGYEDDGARVLMRDYPKGDEEYLLPTSELAPFLLFIEDKALPLSRREALLESLRIAVRNWTRDPLYSSYNQGYYHYGAAGFRKWEEHTRKQAAGGDEQGGIGYTHPFLMLCLNDARKSAVAFLHENASLLSDAGKTALERGATLYEREVALLDSEEWHSKSPEEFLEFLTEAAKLESEAVAEIGRALVAESGSQ